MNISKKIVLGISGILLGLSLVAGQAQAALIQGSIGLGGTYTPVPPAPNLGATTGLIISSVVVLDVNGDFNTIIPLVTPVIHNDIPNFTGAGFPLQPLWSVGGFSFDLESINLDSQSNSQINLSGTGTVMSTNPLLDDTNGQWVFTANNAGSSFTFSSSNATVPEPSMIALLGLGMLGFVGSRRLNKKV